MDANIRTKAGIAFDARRLAAGEGPTPQPASETAPKPASETAPEPVFQAFYVKALWDCAADNPGQLNFQEGDIIKVIKDPDGNWWMGELDGQIGLFPANYIEEIPHDKVEEVRKQVVGIRRQREEAERRHKRRERLEWMHQRQREKWHRDLHQQQTDGQQKTSVGNEDTGVGNEDAFAKLESMGFERSAIKAALDVEGGNAERALERLLKVSSEDSTALKTCSNLSQTTTTTEKSSPVEASRSPIDDKGPAAGSKKKKWYRFGSG